MISDNIVLLPKYDVVFKRIFGDQKNSRVLIHFINSIVGYDIESVTILSGDLLPEDVTTKWSRLDVLARTSSGEMINIEIQIKNHGNMIPRTLFYWAQICSGQILRGNDFRELKRTISIIVLDFDLFKNDARYWRKCFIKDNETNEQITDLLEIHFLELRKMREKFIAQDNPVAVWLEFLRNPFSKEVIEAEERIPELKEAKDIFKKVNSNPRDRALWKMREQTMMEEASALNNARREGIERGMEKGIEKGIEKANTSAVLNLTRAGIDIEIIANSLSLSEDKVREIIENETHCRK